MTGDNPQTPARRPLRALVIADKEPELGMPLTDFVHMHAIDVVITAGDLERYMLRGIDTLTIPTMGVYGNHCDRKYLDVLAIENLHLTTVTVAGVTFTGLEGSVRYKPDPQPAMYTQDEYRDLVAALPAADVLVTHCPPRGINDHGSHAHVGIDALLGWLDRVRPTLMIHGHTHPRNGVVQHHGQTAVEWVYGARIIEI